MSTSLSRSIVLCLTLGGLLFSGSLVSAFDGGSISALYTHTCGIKTDGTLTCWGDTGNGQSSILSGTFSQVSTGPGYTCGIKTDGTLVCGGYNSHGQSIPPSGIFSQISAGAVHACGIKTDSTVVCWGGYYTGQYDPPPGTFKYINSGNDYVCGIKTDGTVACWGRNDYGQSTPPSGIFSQISAGNEHTCGLKTNGIIECWGRNDYRQPSSFSGTFSQISAGGFHTCGLKTNGTIECWGSNDYGQSTPPPGTFSQISIGWQYNCGLKTDGTVVCWGNNDHGQSTPPADLFSVPVELVSVSPSDSATGVSIYRPIISATFSTPIDISTLIGNILLTSSIGTSVPITVVSNTGGVIQIRPDNNFIGSTMYTVTYMTGIVSTLGTHLASNKSTSFTTQYIPPPQDNIPTLIDVCPINIFCSYNTSGLPDSVTHIHAQYASEETKVHTQNIADPVTLSNGESTYTNTFFRIPNRGMDYELTLTNRSRVNYNGPIGYNWDHTYNRFLHPNPDGSIDYHDGKLGIHRFIRSASGSFVPDNILRATLAQVGSGYTITYLDGRQETYGSNLYITNLRDASNNQLNFVYDTGAKLTTITDGNNNQINYSYYPDGRIMTVTAPSNRSVTFQYDYDYNLTSIDMLNTGNTKNITYTYSSGTDQNLAHNLVSFTDAKGQVYVTNTYDANDRVIAQVYGSGTVNYLYTLNGSGDLVTKNTVTNRRGIITEYLYDLNGNTTSMTIKGTGGLADTVYTYAYDTYGRKITETKPLGNGTKYVYNGSGNIIESRIKANIALADDPNNDLITRYVYDAYGNTTQVTAPNGKVTNLAYDTSNRLIRTEVLVGTGMITSTYSYDTYGRLIQKLDGQGNPIVYEYNSLHLPTKVKTGTGTEQSIVTYTYDIYGNPLTMTDGQNNTTNFSYDAFDRLISETSPEGVVKGCIVAESSLHLHFPRVLA